MRLVGAEAVHPRTVAANKDGDVSDTAPRGQRFDARFERAILERLIIRGLLAINGLRKPD